MSDPRIAKIIALLRTRGDLWPYPKGSSLRRRKAGFVGKVKVDCETCAATGKLKNGRDCAHCKGRGFTKVDPYDEPIKGTGPIRAEHGDPKCQHCEGRGVLPNEKRCIWCRGSGRITRPPKLPNLDAGYDIGPADHLDEIWDALLWRIERGSWPQLDLALDRLELEYPRTHRLIEMIYLMEPEDSISGEVLTIEDLDDHDLKALVCGLLYLSGSMPLEIKVPGYAKEYSRKKADARGKGRHANQLEQTRRNEKILKLADRGWTHQKIATFVGLERSVVTKVIRKFTKEAA